MKTLKNLFPATLASWRFKIVFILLAKNALCAMEIARRPRLKAH